MRESERLHTIGVEASPEYMTETTTAPNAFSPIENRSSRARDVFSVDLEDYFHVEAFADRIPKQTWQDYPSRVEGNTRRLLDLLDEHHVRATFFILGWAAERFPALIREVVARGHEPACHSYWHRLIYTLSWDQFHADTGRAKDVIEQLVGRPVRGYRAPSYSITTKSLWAFEVLAELGFGYDSSVFPIRHDVYGMPRAPFRPFRIMTKSGPLLEFPITTFRLPGTGNLPVAGGGYLRLLPFWYTRVGIARLRREHGSLISYIHPWEIDPQQPRVSGRLRSRLRHYTNLSKTEGRLRALFDLGNFTSFEQSELATLATDINFAALEEQ